MQAWLVLDQDPDPLEDDEAALPVLEAVLPPAVVVDRDQGNAGGGETETGRGKEGAGDRQAMKKEETRYVGRRKLGKEQICSLLYTVIDFNYILRRTGIRRGNAGRKRKRH